MPGPEVLNMPGRRDGQTKMVRDGNTVSGKKYALKNRTSISVCLDFKNLFVRNLTLLKHCWILAKYTGFSQ